MKHVIIANLLTSVSALSFGVRTTKVDLHRACEAGVIAATVATCAISPALAGNYDEGEKIFNVNCAACHAGGQNVIMPEKTLEKEALEQYLRGGRFESSVVTQVTNGKNAMPAFGGRLSDDDINNVATFVIETSEKGWDD